MARVELDADDVQTLLFATGVTKAMEAAVRMTTADEQFRSVQPKLAAAHDRVAKAWREVTRRETFPQRYEPATEFQRALLIGLARRGAASDLGMEMDREDPARHRSLLGAGFIDYGVHQQRIVWGASGDVTFKESPKQRLRLTLRGREAIGGVLDLTDPLPPVPPRDRGCDRRPWWKRLLP